jgi:ectoine hydroxylase-related dioxygenase (phytanoyl-CoA dioxygenase family)
MSATTKTGLREEFRERGYVKVPGFFSDEEIEALRRNIIEAGAQLEEANNLNKDNMVFYSNLFRTSPSLQAFLTQKKVIDLVCSIGDPDLWIRWDQCVAKAPGGAEFPWHQDNAYNKLKDEHYQFWVAVTDMTLENGGLWVQPGSHKQLWPHKRLGNHLACAVTPGEETFCAAKKGDVIIFSSKMLHRTKRNSSNSDRWAYVAEYMSLEHYDPLVEAPFFIAAENGKPVSKMADSYRGHARLGNRMKYLPLEVIKHVPPGLQKKMVQVKRKINMAMYKGREAVTE